MPNFRYIRFEGRRPPNPFVQALGFVAGVAVFVLSVIVGGILLAALVGFVLLALAVIYVRVWWLQRTRQTSVRGDDVVDAEYEVIDVRNGTDSTQQRSQKQ